MFKSNSHRTATLAKVYGEFWRMLVRRLSNAKPWYDASGNPQFADYQRPLARAFAHVVPIVRKLLKPLGLATSLKIGREFICRGAIPLRRRAAVLVHAPAERRRQFLMFVLINNQYPAAHRCCRRYRRDWLSRTQSSRKPSSFRQPAVGGVKIDVDGVVSNPQVGELKAAASRLAKGPRRRCRPIWRSGPTCDSFR